MLRPETYYTTNRDPSFVSQNQSVPTWRASGSSRQSPFPWSRVALATSLFAMPLLVSDCPAASRLQGVAAFLTLQPRLKSRLINRQVEHLRAAEQFTEHRHHFCRGGKNDLVHGFGFALACVSIEIDPASIRA